MGAMARGKQAKTKAKQKPRKQPAPRKAAKAREADEDREPSDIELMLQTLSCPTMTAERLCEVCAGSIEMVKDDLNGIAAAELVWRERPDRPALASAVQRLAGELERHAETMLALYDEMRGLADDEADHADLEIADVMARLRPMVDALPPED